MAKRKSGFLRIRQSSIIYCVFNRYANALRHPKRMVPPGLWFRLQIAHEQVIQAKISKLIRTELLANFEALIRSALTKQDSSNRQVREKVYQSSRNALQRMIAANRSLTVENALTQQRALEASILHIEADMSGAVPQAPVQQTQAPVPPPPQQAPPTPQQAPPPPQHVQPQTAPPNTPAPAIQSAPVQAMPHSRPLEPALSAPALQPVSPNPDAFGGAPGVQVEQAYQSSVDVSHPGAEIHLEEMDSYQSPPPEFSHRRKMQKKLFGFLAIGFILGFLLWLGYVLFGGFVEDYLFRATQNDGRVTSLDPSAGQSENSDYITILEASDPSALITAGRGTAEIVNERNANMLRIVSVRENGNHTTAANPIQLKIKPGVLEQISGKKVTVEIYAKSGGSGPAAFAVECQLGGLGSCGRKRFRVGLQPEAAVFSVTMRSDDGSGANAHLAISTDITSNAEITGEGDPVDIIYVRLRVGN